MKKISFVLITLLVSSVTCTSANPILNVIKRAVPLSSGGTRIALPFDRNEYPSHIDYLYSIGNGPFIQNGSTTITYNENGSIIKTESIQKNTDNIINLYSSLNTTIPLNATLHKIKVQTDDEDRNEIYYIDSETGQRHDISVSITTNYNGEPAYVIEKKLNKAGNMIEYAKVESEFDGQGRPVVTVFYSPHYTEQDSMYLDLYKKLEYEYLPDGLVSTTTSHYIINPDGNSYWQPTIRTIYGTDAEGYYCDELLDFDTTISAWKGIEKRRELINEDESTKINWEWNDDTGKWVPYDMSIERFNEYGSTIYHEKYSYDTTLGAFYLDYKEGADYIGDSLTSEWSINYDKPQTIEQLSDPESLISWNFKYSDIYYTEQELGISLSDYPNLELPQKRILFYSVEGYENGVYNWVQDEIIDYEYALVPDSYDNPVLTFKETSEKHYTLNNTNNEWYLSWENKWKYDEYGTYIFREFYENGSIYDRKTFQYKYVTRVDGDSSYIEKLPVLKTSSDIYHGVYTPYDSTYYEYDNENRLIYTYSFSDWNFADSIWEEQIRDKITYENNIVTEVYSEWDFEEEDWFDYKKCTTEYYPSGELKNLLSYHLTLDARDSLFWMTYDSVNTVKDDADRIILKESYYYLDPNTNLWFTGFKEEITYDDTTLTKTSVRSIMDQKTNEWYPMSKNIEQKNLLGEVILSESYQWDNDLNCWIGTEKNEEEHDINGNVIHSASYEWDPDSLRWIGITRTDSEFDDSGELIFECTYDSTDAKGNWIPLTRMLNYYDASDILHSESYMWDSDRNDWRGMSKYETYSSPFLKIDAYYIWDDDEWCWQGVSKEGYIIRADTYTITQILYVWDKESKAWINDEMNETVVGSGTTDSATTTQFKWNPNGSVWIPNSRQTLSESQDANNGKVDYVLIVNEKYDTDKKEWYHYYSTKDLYVYDKETVVESISIGADITISEGVINVNAADDSRITIVSVSGGVVATGTHSVSASVGPGIYLINVDGKTAKVVTQ